MQEEGKLPGDHAVPCQVVTDEHALEMSLAENTVRLAMHPADEFEAFARLIDGGDSVEQIAERFGVTARHVEQRLRLGKVAPELLEAYRAEKLTLECLMAFTITDDREKQLQVYRGAAGMAASDPRTSGQMLTDEMAEATSKLARFVGLDAYHAAGGVSRADLFGDQVYLENPDLLHQLAADKLDGVRQELEAEGWKWVEVSPDRDWNVIQRLRPDLPAAGGRAAGAARPQRRRPKPSWKTSTQSLEDTESDALIDALEEAEAKLAEIEEKLESFVAYDPEDMRSAGCYVSIGHDGELSRRKRAGQA